MDKMKTKLVVGSIIAVVILVLVSFSPSITADVSKLGVDVVEEDVTPTPIVLVLQLIAKLRNHKDIQNVETEDDVLQIIEGDEKLNSIYEQLSAEDCGCEDDNSALDWRFPVICTFLYPLWMIAGGILFLFHIWQFIEFMDAIGNNLNCWWA